MLRRAAAIVIGASLLAAAPVAQAQPAATAEVVPVDVPRFAATLAAIAADGTITFDVDNAPRTLPLADLVTFGALAEPRRGLEILLTDGGMLTAATAHTDGEKLAIDSDLLGEHTLPLKFVAGIIFQPPIDLQQRDRLVRRVRAADARADRLLLENGDELRGTIANITDSRIDIESQGQHHVLPIELVAAASFDPSLAAASASTAGAGTIVGLRDGSRLVVRGPTADAETALLTIADGAAWKAPTAAIVFLQPLDGRAKYLSDRQAESYRHLPYLTTKWEYETDANVTGTQLRAAGHPYAKGIGMHSAGRLTYRLDKKFRTFAADLAIDDVAGRGGSVVFVVYVDDKQALRSEVIRGSDAPMPITVDVTGGTRLSLLVEYAEQGDTLDRADWLNARLVEESGEEK